MTKIRLLFLSYICSIIALFLYSFTQVDLSLTLSKLSIYQIIQKQFQYLGFYQRTNSAIIFFVIISILFSIYLALLYLARKDKLKVSILKITILFTAAVLVFSYNAFSYDLFNYIFDAKIFTIYHQNPYMFAPMDFSSDPMLNFMRWTHRVYPYGPSWLVLTVPLSLIGKNIFLLTFFLFKILMGLTFLGSTYLIYKISEIVNSKDKIFNTVFFAFNPLVLIEGLVSAHNDFPLIFFGLLSIFFYLKKKNLYSFLSLIFSIGVKYSTAILIPVYFFIMVWEKREKKVDWEKVFIFSTVLSIGAVIFASYRTTFQPWYLMLPFSLGAMVSRKYFILIPSVILSVTCLLVYLVYVFMTDYAKGYPQIIGNVELVGLGAAALSTLAYFLKVKLLTKD